MKCGKLTESIYERSVISVMKANSTENRKFYDGAGLGADCAVLAAGTPPGGAVPACAGIVSGQALASGSDRKVIARAYLAAVNQMTVCSANAGTSARCCAYANVTVVVPQKMREIKVRGMIEEAAVQAEETGTPVMSCNVQVLPSAAEPAAVCVVSAGLENGGDSSPEFSQKRAPADADIVMTKWLGIEGTAVIAQGSGERLRGRYPADLVEEAAAFYRYLSVIPEAATAVKSGAYYLHAAREGGVFGSLWELAAANGVGLVVDLKRIPVRQETVEVCEFFDLNPYELSAGGSLLIVAPNGGEMVQKLADSGVPATVIGRTAQGNDRIVRHGEETRFLGPADGDQLHIYYARALEKE